MSTPEFTVPPFAVGTGHRFTISTSEVARRRDAFTCPVGLALGARVRAGTLRSDDPSARPRFDPAEKLTMAVQRALPALSDGASARQIIDGEPDLTHSQRRFLRHAADVLPDLLPEASAGVGVEYRLGQPIIGRVRADRLSGAVTVWALHLHGAGPSGPVHEAVRLRMGPLRTPDEQARDWVAVAAASMASDDDIPRDARLRVSEFSVLDGDLRCRFDGSAADAVRALSERGPLLWEALGSNVFRPGSACARCAFRRVCPAVPARPGVLGVPAGVATRKLSASDLASYARCPTAYRVLRGDHLPARPADGADPGLPAAVHRGLAVHGWLAWAHAREPARRCAPADLPPPGTQPAADAAAEAGLDADGYTVAHPYLVQHLPHCLVGHPELGGWTPERRVVVHDGDADVIVVTTPDLACRVAGTGDPVWRETKTSGTVPADLAAAMLRYPDFALDIVLLADQARRAGGTAQIELEVLTPGGAAVLATSTDDHDIVSLARDLVTTVAGSFVTDLEFARRPSAACAGCAAYGWCDPPDDRIAPAVRAAGGDDDAADAPF